jgi:tRNA A37 N6-isopentenylltransferase MiaA
MRTVGYRQAWDFLDGKLDRERFRAAGIAATRQLAKRQYTWLRATPARRARSADVRMRDEVLKAVEDAVAAGLRRRPRGESGASVTA